jgi:aldose 1-epimerase
MSSSSSADDCALRLLQNDHWQVGVLPDTGASLAFGRVRIGEDWFDLLRPTSLDGVWQSMECSSYVLVPWSNRVRDGVLRYGGHEYRLRRTMEDRTAIHGAALDFPWRVESAESTGVVLTFDSTDFVGVNYPWRFSARVEYRLDGAGLEIATAVRNEDSEPIPVGFGHHPFFQRELTGPGDAVELQVPCREYFELERCLPSAPAVPVEPRVDFTRLRPLGTAFVDDCLTGRDPEAPIQLVYPGSGVRVTMRADEVFSNVVVYIPTGERFFAVEPVTNANDAFNLHAWGVPGSGLIVLEPGRERSGTMRLDVARIADVREVTLDQSRPRRTTGAV